MRRAAAPPTLHAPPHHHAELHADLHAHLDGLETDVYPRLADLDAGLHTILSHREQAWLHDVGIGLDGLDANQILLQLGLHAQLHLRHTLTRGCKYAAGAGKRISCAIWDDGTPACTQALDRRTQSSECCTLASEDSRCTTGSIANSACIANSEYVLCFLTFMEIKSFVLSMYKLLAACIGYISTI
ncbi:uncharacterized protein LOC119299557 [Triticum dicoccoides]|uniref:uncharacterized protein LOC119299557 n=1 Tax=Triticum dicoccoides TaxID=85692 RepID=UPI00188F4584|nr:uncharacterized protein LOC119299557 [Triticum dicoccoides]